MLCKKFRLLLLITFVTCILGLSNVLANEPTPWPTKTWPTGETRVWPTAMPTVPVTVVPVRTLMPPVRLSIYLPIVVRDQASSGYDGQVDRIGDS